MKLFHWWSIRLSQLCSWKKKYCLKISTQYLFIFTLSTKDAVDVVGTTVCGGETRLKTVYVSKSNRIEIQMINVGSAVSLSNGGSGSNSASAAVHHHQQQHQHHHTKQNYAFAFVYEGLFVCHICNLRPTLSCYRTLVKELQPSNVRSKLDYFDIVH